ncbi:DNA polymerase subunit gamma-2, mitochondrial isoform X1 [Rhinichthys klamathensis goyatoka]|uniref:DNA polymerase subunit gamma-2, mitochondrial isoform X1 n=2 Tax=Rhinichthys klamathensis goyatoka TaxID=3034132 RepID=UPI0024B51A70|nr:DNA polymerase subunit gamma-2, mitochondrial isoform X1 [Rhinichthys klamathensis goyatoka]
MLLHCIRRRLQLLSEKLPWYRNISKCITRDDSSDETSLLMQLCAERYYISSEAFHTRSCTYGPLGTELKKNIIEQWTSAIRSRAYVFGINTSALSITCEEPVRIVDIRALKEILNQDSFTKEEASQKIQKLLKDSASVRTSLLQGALQQYTQALELVNRTLPFGLAEIGLCHHFDNQLRHSSSCSFEVTESSLVWFCSPRTSSQWMDYWAHQRLQWWRKFALGPSDFSMCNVVDEELREGTSHGVKILYKFPWGSETLETLWSLGDTQLIKTLQGSCINLQCRDGRKSVVPHVISVSANVDQGMLAYLFNSLQLLKKTDSKQKLHQRTVLKLHPSLTPVKVALDMGRGSNSELRQVCEGLLQEFLEVGISTWPGYLDTMSLSLENLHTKYDEMGVLFTVVVSESTLKSGLLLVRNRDTTIRETMHISEIKCYLLKYISASDNI